MLGLTTWHSSLVIFLYVLCIRESLFLNFDRVVMVRVPFRLSWYESYVLRDGLACPMTIAFCAFLDRLCFQDGFEWRAFGSDCFIISFSEGMIIQDSSAIWELNQTLTQIVWLKTCETTVGTHRSISVSKSSSFSSWPPWINRRIGNFNLFFHELISKLLSIFVMVFISAFVRSLKCIAFSML